MKKRLNPNWFPNYEQKSVVDRYMGMLDCHGLSRRKFLALASCSAVASATAASFGIPAVAVADEGGKIAHLIMTQRLEYCVNADAGARQAAQALGMTAASVDGQLDSRTPARSVPAAACRGCEGRHAPRTGRRLDQAHRAARQREQSLSRQHVGHAALVHAVRCGRLLHHVCGSGGVLRRAWRYGSRLQGGHGQIWRRRCRRRHRRRRQLDRPYPVARPRRCDQELPQDQACRRTARKVESRRFCRRRWRP